MNRMVMGLWSLKRVLTSHCDDGDGIGNGSDVDDDAAGGDGGRLFLLVSKMGSRVFEQIALDVVLGESSADSYTFGSVPWPRSGIFINDQQAFTPFRYRVVVDSQ